MLLFLKIYNKISGFKNRSIHLNNYSLCCYIGVAFEASMCFLHDSRIQGKEEAILEYEEEAEVFKDKNYRQKEKVSYFVIINILYYLNL